MAALHVLLLLLLFLPSPFASVEKIFFVLFRTLLEVGLRNMLNGPTRHSRCAFLLPRFYVTRAYLSVGSPLTNWRHRGRNVRDTVEKGVYWREIGSIRFSLLVVFIPGKKSAKIHRFIYTRLFFYFPIFLQKIMWFSIFVYTFCNGIINARNRGRQRCFHLCHGTDYVNVPRPLTNWLDGEPSALDDVDKRSRKVKE